MSASKQEEIEDVIRLITIKEVQFSRSVVSDSLRPHGLQHARPPCPSPTPRVYSNSCPSSRWCHPAISSSVVPFSYCPQSLPASGSFPMSQLFARGGLSTGVSASASVLPMNTQDWSLGRTGYIWLKNLNYTKYTLSQNIRPNAFYKWAPPDFSIIGKDRDAGKDWGQEKKGAVEDEMGVWHY